VFISFSKSFKENQNKNEKKVDEKIMPNHALFGLQMQLSTLKRKKFN